MAKKKVFVSFDFEKNKNYKYLLNAWNVNPDFEFAFNDCSSGEIQSSDVSRVKAALSTKIANADYTLVIIGEDANKMHKDWREIGYRNWQNFEIAKSVFYRNRIVGVKLDRSFASPEELLGNCDAWAYEFAQDKIIEALKNA